MGAIVCPISQLLPGPLSLSPSNFPIRLLLCSSLGNARCPDDFDIGSREGPKLVLSVLAWQSFMLVTRRKWILTPERTESVDFRKYLRTSQIR